ncbi:MAG: hypothetical protein JNM70_20830 [Anaerolineae bacterium]|nr:hypothetical protein [Anaerolineae bacterium]
MATHDNSFDDIICSALQCSSTLTPHQKYAARQRLLLAAQSVCIEPRPAPSAWSLRFAHARRSITRLIAQLFSNEVHYVRAYNYRYGLQYTAYISEFSITDRLMDSMRLRMAYPR